MAAKDKQPEESAEVAVPKKSKKKKIVLIIILLLLLGAGGAASFWFFQLRTPGDKTVTPSQTTESGQTATSTEPSTVEAPRMLTPSDMPRPLTIVPLPSINVNLADAAGDRFLKIGMEVEVSLPETAAEIQSQMPRIRDALIILLSSKSFAELSTAEGKMLLKNEIADRLNKILGVPRVVRIYFTDFVVQ